MDTVIVTGDTLFGWRMALGLSMTAAAKKLGVHHSKYIRWENKGVEPIPQDMRDAYLMLRKAAADEAVGVTL